MVINQGYIMYTCIIHYYCLLCTTCDAGAWGIGSRNNETCIEHHCFAGSKIPGAAGQNNIGCGFAKSLGVKGFHTPFLELYRTWSPFFRSCGDDNAL